MQPPTADTPDKGEEVIQEPGGEALERATRSIILKPEIASDINEGFIDFQFYNCFNYSLLSADGKSVNLTLGITSANPGEGKTLVACNLAVSLAMGYGKETVLVDLNLEEPRIHDICNGGRYRFRGLRSNICRFLPQAKRTVSSNRRKGGSPWDSGAAAWPRRPSG